MAEVKLLSSLEKVFSGDELKANEQTNGSMLKNEIYSFQLTVKSDIDILAGIEIDSSLKEFIKVYTVGEVPSDLPCYPDWKDDDYIKTEPGLYPDALFDNTEQKFEIKAGKWSAVWFSIEGDDSFIAGEYPIKITLNDENGGILAVKEYIIEVIGISLPKQKLMHTEWFYMDCIAALHNTEVFSEKCWELTEKYMKTAVKYGQNMIFTQIFTPAFFTEKGEERPTVQLVDITVDGGKYSFGFDKLKRFIDLALSCGIEYFEMSHLYMQWDIKTPPKIMATVNGEYKKIFGADTDASEDEYKAFITQFLTELTAFLDKEKINGKCYFHVADEPRLENLEAYTAARNTMESVLKGKYKILEALSDFEFYKTGAVDLPVPSNDHIEPFLQNKVENLWTYYCCSQGVGVSNRFYAMPSYRNRIIAEQLYKYNLQGFLHAGFNNWFTFFGKIYPVNPFLVTDCAKAFPSGDVYFVYPGEDGPVISIRLLVFNEALQDLRAFLLLESITSKEEVMALIEEGLEKEITFSRYPKSSDYILNLRARVNAKIKSLIK